MLPKPLSLLAAGCLLYFITSAQDDTSALRLGNFDVSKKFSQHSTVSGRDLEKIPFTSLHEAINVYFNGVYTTAANVVYVIDGNMGADVNAYSVHDIETVTLVNDARAINNGPLNGKQLILITTKSVFTRKSGITIAASEHVVKDSITAPYHNVYIGGRWFKKNIEIGGSINYQHEAFRVYTSREKPDGTPNKFNRYAINGWMNASIGGSLLTVRINASPGDSLRKNSYDDWFYTKFDERKKSTWLQAYPSLRLTSKIGKHFYNELNALYLSSHDKSRYKADLASDYGEGTVASSSSYRQQIIQAREQIGYSKTSGKWTFNPALNITGRLQTLRTRESYREIFAGGGGAAMSESWSKIKKDEVLISPVVNLRNEDIFNVQAGVQYRSGYFINQFKKENKLYPFASVAVDVVRAFDRNAKTSLMITASQAQYRSDLVNYIFSPTYLFYVHNGVVDTILVGGNGGYEHQPHNATSIGATLKLPKNLEVQYTFERHSYHVNLSESEPVPGGNYSVIAKADIKQPTHRLAISYSLDQSSVFRYSPTLVIYKMKAAYDYKGAMMFWQVMYQDDYPRNGWSGGFVNRFEYKRLSAGLNLLYMIKQHNWVYEHDDAGTTSAVLKKENSFAFQHLFIGYDINNLNIFVSARNINRDRKYIGAGAKMNF